MQETKIILDFEKKEALEDKKIIDALIKDRCLGEFTEPKLVEKTQLKKLGAYNRFRDLEKKSAFREKLLETLKKSLPQNDHNLIEFIQKFKKLAEEIETNESCHVPRHYHCAVKLFSRNIYVAFKVP